MQRRPDLLRDLEDSYVATHPLSYPDALRLYEALWKEAHELGVLPGPDPWEGLAVDIRLARILATCSPSS